MEESKCGIWKDGNECSWRVQDKDYHFRILIRICDRLSTLLWYLLPLTEKTYLMSWYTDEIVPSTPKEIIREINREIIGFELKQNLFTPTFNSSSIFLHLSIHLSFNYFTKNKYFHGIYLFKNAQKYRQYLKLIIRVA